MSDILKRPELLKEANREFDFFSFDEYARSLHNNLKSTTTPSVTALVGKYGSGKSVLLNEVRKLTEESKAKNKARWVFFECWQYPDKRDLWEALILELVADINGKKLDQEVNPYSDITGWRDELSGFLRSTSGALATLAGLVIVYWLIFSKADDKAKELLLALSTSLVLILLASVQTLIKPQDKSAVSRLEDYKQELEKVLLQHNGPLYIVLEDVDRAGELGSRFFETVSHFVKESKFSKKNIKVIVPVADVDGDNKLLRDSIDKASDNILYFNPSFNCDKFITELFSDDFLTETTKQLLTSTINPLIGRDVSIRKMKHLLRNALIKHKRLRSKEFSASLEMCIAVEFSKYMQDSLGGQSIYAHSHSKYEHRPLYQWCLQNSIIDLGEAEPEKAIDPRDHFKKSDDIFPDIRLNDVRNIGTNRGSKPLYYREYLISRAYFDDL